MVCALIIDWKQDFLSQKSSIIAKTGLDLCSVYLLPAAANFVFAGSTEINAAQHMHAKRQSISIVTAARR